MRAVTIMILDDDECESAAAVKAALDEYSREKRGLPDMIGATNKQKFGQYLFDISAGRQAAPYGLPIAWIDTYADLVSIGGGRGYFLSSLDFSGIPYAVRNQFRAFAARPTMLHMPVVDAFATEPWSLAAFIDKEPDPSTAIPMWRMRRTITSTRVEFSLWGASSHHLEAGVWQLPR